MVEEEAVGRPSNLSLVRISPRRLDLSSPPSPAFSSSSSPLSSPPSTSFCSSCPSTPLVYFLSTPELLIPGLPDDLALSCLLRLPLVSQAIGRSVCRTWYRTLSSDTFFQTRRTTGLADSWLLVLAFHKVTGKIQWQAFDLAHQSWHIISPMPYKERVCPPAFGCVSVPDDASLFVCGGMRLDMDCPMHSVLKYELFKNKWTVVRPMSTPRSFFASGLIDGRIYTAGGSGTDSCELNCAEVYDPAEDRWQPVANMGISMACYDAAVLNGKFYVTEGWSWPYLLHPRGQIYDPKTDQWENMTEGMREGWTGFSVVLDGYLYIISEHDNSKLKVYDMETDSWSSITGTPMPSFMSLPFSFNTIDGKLLVVTRSLHIAIGGLTHTMHDKKGPAISVEWQAIHAPERFSDFIPSHSAILYA